MIYLLGGPPRVGKSIIAAAIQKEVALSVVSTDTLAAVLTSVMSPEAAPDLFVFDRFHELSLAEQTEFIRQDPAGFMDYVKRESFVVWNAAVALMLREREEGRHVLIEGVAVLPELVCQIEDLPYRVVFIGNQSRHHKDHLKQSAQENKHDWMRDVGEQYMEAFAQFVKQMSADIEQGAREAGFAYIEIDSKPLADVAQEVMHALELSAG